MRSVLIIPLFLALAFSSSPAHAADQCASRVVIFSSNSAGTSAVNPHAFVCLTGGVDGVDSALIFPGSDRVNVRFLGDLGEAVPTLDATLAGLGAHATVTLTRMVDPTLGVTYDEAGHTAIDPLATGSITATVLHNSAPIDAVTYHTATATTS